jgi:alanyl-tRNA synthetase
MSARIYYRDPSCRAFAAVVIRAFEHEGRPAAVLDTTAFYPTSGGQPFDTGRLGAAAVVDVVDVGDDVVHVLSEPLAAGMRVHGAVDWTRRFDHMQQHTGQHVLSAAFARLFDNRTTSFHMGAELSTLDLAREMSTAEIDGAVDEANRVVWENRPVSIRFVSPAEAARLPLRKDPAREGTLRLIEVAEFDLSACGGTHVTRTGEIGAIAVTAAERARGGSRVTFVCGGRMLRVFRSYREAIAGSVRMLPVLPPELPAAVERVQLENRELRKSVGRLQASVAGSEAARLVASATASEGVKVVVAVLEGWDAAGLKTMASALMTHERVAAALISSATPAAVVVARTADAGGVDANAVLRQLLARFGGKGGGKADLAQGGGLQAPPAEIASAARALLSPAGPL